MENHFANAVVVADKIYTSPIKSKERDLNALMEILCTFSEDDCTETWYPFFSCEGLIQELAFLLTNPDISSKLSSEYYKKNAGMLLRKMTRLFSELADSNNIQDFILYNSLKGGMVKSEDLKEIDNRF